MSGDSMEATIGLPEDCSEREVWGVWRARLVCDGVPSDILFRVGVPWPGGVALRVNGVANFWIR